MKAGDEHQDKTAELGEKHQRARRLAAVEDMEVEQVQSARTEHHAHQQLAENGWYPEAATERSGDLHRWEHDRDQQRELKRRLHAA